MSWSGVIAADATRPLPGLVEDVPALPCSLQRAKDCCRRSAVAGAFLALELALRR
jgi:hypothetical protein